MTSQTDVERHYVKSLGHRSGFRFGLSEGLTPRPDSPARQPCVAQSPFSLAGLSPLGVSLESFQGPPETLPCGPASSQKGCILVDKVNSYLSKTALGSSPPGRGPTHPYALALPTPTGPPAHLPKPRLTPKPRLSDHLDC